MAASMAVAHNVQADEESSKHGSERPEGEVEGESQANESGGAGRKALKERIRMGVQTGLLM